MKTNEKNFQRTDNKTFILRITIKKEDILKEYQEAIKHVQNEFETKGFRKGKVPLDVVEQQINKEHIVEDVASKLISKSYTEQVKEHDLKPIIQPQVDFKNPPASFDKDWEIELTSCELPVLELSEKYVAEVKKINAEKPEKETVEAENKKVDQTIDVLIKNSKVKLPDILVNSDIEHHLSNLIEQAQQVGLTVPQYLKGKNQTLEQYKETLKAQIEKEWTINLAISKVAEAQKIEVTEKEVDEIVKGNPNLSSNLNFVYYLLIQQKVFAYLKKL